MVIFTYIVTIFLLVLSGIFSGLTLGLMGLDVFDLKRKVKVGDKQAKKIYPLREKGNLLLITLLLGNVAVNSALAVFLGSLTTGIIAAVVSTGLIVIFGEILPQAFFSRYALKVGAKMSWLVYIFLYLFYPISKPLANVLDRFLGGELPTIFSKQEFQVFLEEQKDLQKSDIKKHEFEILQGGLVFAEKKVSDVMTPRVNTFFIRDTAKLTPKLLQMIHKKGHTRIPVYKTLRDKIVGMLYVKDLIKIDPYQEVPVGEVMRKEVHYIGEEAKLDKVLNLFKEKRRHLFVVRDDFKGISGIVTLEDVLEEIVGEIVDEFDEKVDMRKV